MIAFSVSLDALGAGFTYGLKDTRIPFLSRFLICFIALLCSLLATNLGGFLSLFLPLWAGSMLSAIILLVLGISMLVSSIRESLNGTDSTDSDSQREYHWVLKFLNLTIMIVRHPMRCDLNRSNTIDTLGALLLGVSFSLDAFGMGIGYGLIGELWTLPILTALFHFLLLSLGQLLGRILRRNLLTLDKLLSFLPGCIMILLGAFRIAGIL